MKSEREKFVREGINSSCLAKFVPLNKAAPAQVDLSLDRDAKCQLMDQMLQVDGETGDEPDESAGLETQESLDFCKIILKNLQRDSYDKFQVLNLCEKFAVNVRDLIFSKQKYMLQKVVLEHIMKEENNESNRRLLDETVAYLNLKKDSVYGCCLVGCLFSSPFHRKYIRHLKLVHVKYDSYLCQFKHKCERRFTSIHLLNEHLTEAHSAAKPKASQTRQAESDFKIPCKCILRNCNGLSFRDVKELLGHINNFHVNEHRACVFENCSVKFKPGSASRHHFRLKHLDVNNITLKDTHLVLANLAVNSEGMESEVDEPIDVIDFASENYDEICECYGEEEDDEGDEDFFLKAYADFFNRMCHFKFVPHSTMQTIATEFLEHSLKAVNERERALRNSLRDIPGMTSSQVDDVIRKVLHDDKMLKAQKELDTVHKRNLYIKQNFNFVEPVEHILNKEEVKAGHPKQVYHYVPLDKAFRFLVEDRTFNQMMENERNKDKAEKEVLKDIKDGSVYKSVEYFQSNPDALVCLLYSDAVELTNPLSSGKGKHKIVQIFWTLADIPRNQRSKIDRIQLALVVKEKTLKKYGEKIIYKHLVNDLKKLEEGIEIKTPVRKLVKCGLLVHSADNLEAMQVGGFSTCFSSRDICRHCHCQYKDLNDHIHDFDGDGPHSYWTIDQYDEIVNSLEMEDEVEDETDVEDELNLFETRDETSDEEFDESDHDDDSQRSEDEADDSGDSDEGEVRNRYGLRKRCPFNSLQAFHAVYGFPPDVLHDLFEGSFSQDLCGVIKILSDKGWFSLDEYNNSLKKQDFKSFERSDRPQEIKSFKQMKLPGKAVSVWTHIRNFGFIIQPFVMDYDDQVLALATEIGDIVERVTAVEIRQYEIDVLEEKILDYMEHRKLVFEEFPSLMGKTKPKHHYLTHYPDAIRGFGPCLSFWTGKGET